MITSLSLNAKLLLRFELLSSTNSWKAETCNSAKLFSELYYLRTFWGKDKFTFELTSWAGSTTSRASKYSRKRKFSKRSLKLLKSQMTIRFNRITKLVNKIQRACRNHTQRLLQNSLLWRHILSSNFSRTLRNGLIARGLAHQWWMMIEFRFHRKLQFIAYSLCESNSVNFTKTLISIYNLRYYYNGQMSTSNCCGWN